MSGLMSDYFSTGSGAPSVAPSVPAGEVAVYVDKSSGNFWVYNAAAASPAWVEVTGSGGSSGITLIGETILTATATSMSVSSIPGTYRALRIEVDGRGDAAAAYEAASLQFNGDSGANYSMVELSASSGAVNHSVVTAQTSLNLGYFPAANATAGMSGPKIIEVPNYARTDFFKACFERSILEYSVIEEEVQGGWWANTAAITSVTVSIASGNLVAGSLLRVWGIS